MASPEGFFNSMSQKGVSQGHYLMNFTYSPTGGVSSTVYPCNSIFTDVDDQGRVIDPSGFVLFQNQGRVNPPFLSVRMVQLLELRLKLHRH